MIKASETYALQDRNAVIELMKYVKYLLGYLILLWYQTGCRKRNSGTPFGFHLRLEVYLYLFGRTVSNWEVRESNSRRLQSGRVTLDAMEQHCCTLA